MVSSKEKEDEEEYKINPTILPIKSLLSTRGLSMAIGTICTILSIASNELELKDKENERIRQKL